MKKHDAVNTGEKTAILVDGAFYRRRAYHLFGDKSPRERADELVEYCGRHLVSNGYRNGLYRIFYYDCPPMSGNLYHPLRDAPINMGKTPVYKWANSFYLELSKKRKLALRMGTIQEQDSGYRLKPKTVNKLCRGEITVEQLTESDFEPNFVQKGVDMHIGIDIASIASKHQADQIVLIAGDSDFVPAAKHARREGIDFVLDPMWQPIRQELHEHIDGLRSCTAQEPSPQTESLHVDHDTFSKDRALRGESGDGGSDRKTRRRGKRR